MPTTRPRYTLTETDDLAAALDAAARLWPESRNDRSALLRQVIELGTRTVIEEHTGRTAARIAAIHRVAGSLDGVYPDGAIDELRSEWPE